MLNPKVYRRRRGEAAWHCCGNCERWPVLDFEETVTMPPLSAVCDACQRRVANLQCDAVLANAIGPPEA